MESEIKPDISTKLAVLSNKTALVEKRLKEAESICGQVIYPAVNELRYLGRNLSKLLQHVIDGEELSSESFETYLIDAELCCTRADHDITDAVFTFISLEVNALRKAYGASLISAHFPDYTAVIETFQKVQTLMAESRGSSSSDREKIYKDIRINYIPKILEFYKNIQTKKELIDENYRLIKKSQICIRVITFVAVLGSISSILAFFNINYSFIF